ncbi:MAG: sulfate adenylyltransferase [Gammaproteobacteria bacterium]|nr:sulfate adenylyltransferase [Gammaproteobacteria bacterium]MDH4256144.1 sulfate adenylyltransferase [Gammaproteobacteria bacterium]MDH5310833.1 sulfate adenylyltransferase [Gammaproteobacteria bacterium]
MIKPHGADALKPLLVTDANERARLVAEAEKLPSLTLNSAAAANAVMLGGGYFTPLAGYMNVADAMSVATAMRTVDGLFWPVPVLNLAQNVDAIRGAKRIALRDPNVEGLPVIAIMDVDAIEEFTAEQIETITREVYGTLDPKHPGVAVFQGLGKYCVSGPIRVLNLSYFETDFPETFRTAVEIREEIGARGWEKVVAFQTRNPMHLAHEELCRMAQERLGADGIVVHMLLGQLKAGDIPADVRDACIRKMVDVYFPENTVMVNGYGFDMLYAGPREAVLHAVFRQNMGATHLIVGRDHAGVGSYYGPFDAQTIFDTLPADALDIEIFAADHTAWSKKLGKVVMMREAPDHAPEDFVMLSGTRVREMLEQGIAPPVEFSRPEVAEILMEYYQAEKKKSAA